MCNESVSYTHLEYISDPSYHDVLILRQVQAQYRFEFGEDVYKRQGTVGERKRRSGICCYS